ncbi:Enoyl reductase domain of yeast-type FAS1 (plasmid) [Variovorax sp. SRS16]|uniref:MaoC/PaaZ C-terminal domain-containing protein n=1 Tax=Variovorax sp. SRS16 TaxID=282217 RepID=UPI00131602FB|nr:MaoC/PaaZ C-terminal domain-containing protein [Variovorax sp. SRS16]VTU46295.1 Enoyl reductase domain of yeast-type FAS1 [Variovorax sp. SRS16]
MTTFDPGALRRFDIERVEHEWRPRDCALYAVSCGMGHDPLDESQLRFADETRSDHVALPSMALVLAYPGFWLARSGTTADPARLMHVEQQIEWHAPIATSGRVTSTTRVTGIYDKGAGGHAFIRSERVLHDASGAALATLAQTHVLRQGGGFGGEPPPKPVTRNVPDAAPAVEVHVDTRPEQALLYRLNGDLFALHSSPQRAHDAGFERPLLHGMCTAGIAMQVLLRTLAKGEPRRFRRVSLRFSAPVFPGNRLLVEAWDDGSFRVRVPQRDVVAIDQGVLELAA